MKLFNNNRVRLDITDMCNLNCCYCHNEGQQTRGNNYLPIEFVEKFSNFVTRNSIEVDSLTITGGEPLLHKDLLNIIEILRPITSKLSLVTNGYFLNEEIICDFASKGLDYIKIGTDSLGNESSKPSLNGESISGEEIKKKIEIGLKYLPIKINVVLYSNSFERIEEILKQSNFLGVDVKFLELIGIHNQYVDFCETNITSQDLIKKMGSYLKNVNYNELLGKWYCNTSAGTKVAVCDNFCKAGICKNLWTRIDSRGFLIPCIHSNYVIPIDLDNDDKAIENVHMNNLSMKCEYFKNQTMSVRSDEKQYR